MIKGKEQQQNESPKDTKKASTKEIVLEAELDQVKKELADIQARENYWKKSYTISRLTAEVIRMETGLPTREVFDIVVNHALRFKDSITYFSGWKVESITFEDQIFITLMKIRRSYTNLHLAQLFSCSVGTIANIVTTFIPTSSPGPSPRSKWRSEKPLAKAAEIFHESWSSLSRDT